MAFKYKQNGNQLLGRAELPSVFKRSRTVIIGQWETTAGVVENVRLAE